MILNKIFYGYIFRITVVHILQTNSIRITSGGKLAGFRTSPGFVRNALSWYKMLRLFKKDIHQKLYNIVSFICWICKNTLVWALCLNTFRHWIIFRIYSIICSINKSITLFFLAVGIYSNIRRQPAEQSLTYRNKNIAIFYCSLRVLANAIPPQVNLSIRWMTNIFCKHCIINFLSLQLIFKF